MITLTFNDSEITSLRGALELARDKYRENIHELQSDARFARLADQFERQAVECETLLTKIED